MNNSGAFNADIFAKNLREARKNKNWTQNQLAEEVNKKGFSIRGATIATYEARDHKKRRQPSMDKAIAIAEALGTTLDDLCGTQNLISVDKSEKVPLNAYFIMLIELAKLSCSNLGIEDGYAEQPYSYVRLSISNDVFVSFFKSWIKIQNLAQGKTITHEMAAEWIKGALQKYEKYTIEDGVVKDQSFEEFEEIEGLDELPF